jgi:amino acid adenylation domain-containing protein
MVEVTTSNKIEGGVATPWKTIEFTLAEVESSIPQRFEKIVGLIPDQIAIKDGNRKITYSELNALANRFAHAIIEERGTSPEPIGLLIDKGIDQVAAILGVLKAGKFFVLLDGSFPDERIAAVVDDCQLAHIWTTHDQGDSVPARLRKVNAAIRYFDKTFSNENPGVTILPDSLATIVYTSGSTGRPKGVIKTHRLVLHSVMVIGKLDEVRPTDRIAALTSGTGNAIFDIFFAALNGTTLLPFRPSQENSAALRDWLIDEKVSICQLAAPLFRPMCDTLKTGIAFPHLRSLRLRSAAAVKSDWELYRRYFPPTCRFINGLTSTEAEFVTRYFVSPTMELDGDEIPIGYPVDHKDILLLDDEGQEVGAEAIGEIVVRSKFLASGYWNNPELTAEKFKRDPTDPDKRLYYTGDLALMLPDGCLIHKGRKDLRIKIRGFGVDLVEVEKELRSYPAVTEAVVIASTRSHDPELIAYYTCGENQNPTVSDLRTHLGNTLADHMIPTHFIKLDAIPLTPNGKVDRQALPAPDTKRPKLNNPYVAAQDDLEAKLVAIWEEVIGKRPIGIDDRFFDLGGHSLLAARLFTRMDESIGRLLPLSILLTTPTIRLLAQQFRNPTDPVIASPLVTFRNTGNLLPIFAVPGVYGNVVGLAELCRELGPDQPFYALQSVGLDGREMPLQTVEEIAARYIGEIKKKYPQGPYNLLGACFGSRVTCEMAHQLLGLRDEIHFLGLLDPIGIALNESDQGASRPRGGENPLRNFLTARWQLYSDEFRNAKGPERLNFITNKIRSVARAVFKKHAFSGVRREIRQLAVLNASKLAGSNYRPKPLRGRLRAFEIFISDHPRHKIIMNFNWRAIWDGDIPIRHSPGRDSSDMLTGANARQLARLLSERLKQRN